MTDLVTVPVTVPVTDLVTVPVTDLVTVPVANLVTASPGGPDDSGTPQLDPVTDPNVSIDGW